MVIDVKKIKSGLSVFQYDDEYGTCIRGEWLEFSSNIEYCAKGNPEYLEMAKNSSYIRQDIWNLKSLIHKLDYLNQKRKNNDLPDMYWLHYAMTDIEFFFTELRSVFDYLSQILCHVSPIDVKQVRDHGKSFRTLFNWLRNSESNQSRFSEDLSNIVLSCDWFWDIRSIRDSIRHGGAYSLIFNVKGEIVFQIYMDKFRKSVYIPELMYNENVVNFKYCAGLYMSYLFDLLESVAGTCMLKLKLKTIGSDPTHIGFTNNTVKQWIEDLILHINSN